MEIPVDIEIGFIGLGPKAEWFLVDRGSTLADFLVKLNKYRSPTTQVRAADCFYDKPFFHPINAKQPIEGMVLVYWNGAKN